MKAWRTYGINDIRLDDIPIPEVIPGSVPDGLHYPKGCKFHPRCPYCQPGEDSLCRTQEPHLEEIEPGHWVACWEAKKINQ